MALKTKTRGRWWSRFHFLVRFVGLTGLVAAGVGAAMAYREDLLQKLKPKESWIDFDWDWIQSAIQGDKGSLVIQLAVGFLVIGAAVAALVLLLDLLMLLVFVTGRRGAFGINALLQIGLAAAIVAAINYYSFSHYQRFDLTNNAKFTLAADLQMQLRGLQGSTTIIVYQRHKTFGQLNDKPDAVDYAAERKVVEKVHDLVEQFRELGPQFNVNVLDVEEEGYDNKLKRLTENNSKLRDAIEAAPENSIFFVAGERVQRLSFNDFYQLDKSASKKNDNLVLLYQGVEPFARKVLNIDEKRPRIGVLVIHEWLTTRGPEDFGLAGFKKVLSAQGFDVQDIILKKWSETAPPEPAVYTYDESKYDSLEEQLAELNSDIRSLEEELKDLTQVQELWKTASLDDLTKKYAKQLGGRKVDQGLRIRQVAYFEQNSVILRAVLSQYKEDREATAKEKATLSVDTAAEQRRISDLKAKLARSIADCDLLFIPRMTIRSVISGDRIPASIHNLDKDQVEAVRDFLKAGKPILVSFGPTTEHPSDRMRMMQMGQMGADDMETLLGQLGIKLGKQTILHNAESKSFAERRTGLLVSSAAVEIPPVEFESLPAAANPLSQVDRGPRKPNPIRSSMHIASDSLGKKLDIQVKYPRPVFFEPPPGVISEFEPEFILTSPASWNEDQPFPSRERTPRFEPPKQDDPTKGTLEEKRRGPFPIGIAVETVLPREWSSDKTTEAQRVRVAAIGNGSVFTGPDLPPAKEELLLNTCNWLLGRDDLLAKADRTWSYPRVQMTAKDQNLWQMVAWLALPGAFAYVGLVVLMLRRLH